MKHFGLTLDLKDDSEAIEKYKTYHRDVWPEVLDSLKRVGINRMKIYLLGRRLFMTIEAIDSFDPARDFSRYLQLDPRCREWDKLMRTFQEPVSEVQTGEWWAMMELVFESDRDKD